VLVETPLTTAVACLPQGNQFGMGEGILLSFTTVTTPTKCFAVWIEHHCCNRYLSCVASDICQPQQAFHPNAVWNIH
jgi:hypothetical protein